MSDAPIGADQEKVPFDERYILTAHHMAIEEDADCPICGNVLRVGQPAIDVPMGTVGRHHGYAPAHLGCAIDGDEVAL